MQSWLDSCVARDKSETFVDELGILRNKIRKLIQKYVQSRENRKQYASKVMQHLIPRRPS